MNISKAISRSTQDIVKSLAVWVAAIIGICIPLLGWFTLLAWAIGYFADCVKEKNKVPEFNFGGQYVIGLKAMLIALVYLIIISIIGGAIIIIAILVDGLIGTGTLLSTLSMPVISLIAFIIGLNGWLGILKFFNTRKLGDGISILIGSLANIENILIYIVGGIISCIPIIGPMAGATILGEYKF